MIDGQHFRATHRVCRRASPGGLGGKGAVAFCGNADDPRGITVSAAVVAIGAATSAAAPTVALFRNARRLTDAFLDLRTLLILRVIRAGHRYHKIHFIALQRQVDERAKKIAPDGRHRVALRTVAARRHTFALPPVQSFGEAWPRATAAISCAFLGSWLPRHATCKSGRTNTRPYP